MDTGLIRYRAGGRQEHEGDLYGPREVMGTTWTPSDRR